MKEKERGKEKREKRQASEREGIVLSVRAEDKIKKASA